MSAVARAASGLLKGMRPFASINVKVDVGAGATLAALAIPACLGYARIAGMPVVTGLYTLLLPLLCVVMTAGNAGLPVFA